MRLFILILISLVCVLFTPSCYVEPKRIAISAEFSTSQQDTISYSAQRWFEMCPELRVEVYISNRATIHPITCDEEGTWGHTSLNIIQHPESYICTKSDSDEFRLIAMHELGHYLTGRASHTKPTSVMQEIMDKESLKLKTLTDRDVRWACK